LDLGTSITLLDHYHSGRTGDLRCFPPFLYEAGAVREAVGKTRSPQVYDIVVFFQLLVSNTPTCMVSWYFAIQICRLSNMMQGLRRR